MEDIDTFPQILTRELPEFRAYCGTAFTQYEEIKQLRGKLKPMTEATRLGRELAGGLLDGCTPWYCTTEMMLGICRF